MTSLAYKLALAVVSISAAVGYVNYIDRSDNEPGSTETAKLKTTESNKLNAVDQSNFSALSMPTQLGAEQTQSKTSGDQSDQQSVLAEMEKALADAKEKLKEIEALNEDLEQQLSEFEELDTIINSESLNDQLVQLSPPDALSLTLEAPERTIEQTELYFS